MNLNGNKTYLLAALGFIWALVGYYLGHLDATTASMIAWTSLTAGALRHGVSKAEK